MLPRPVRVVGVFALRLVNAVVLAGIGIGVLVRVARSEVRRRHQSQQ